MNVSNTRKSFPPGGRDGLQIFGLRPASALAALGLATVGVWVLAQPGDDGSGVAVEAVRVSVPSELQATGGRTLTAPVVANGRGISGAVPGSAPTRTGIGASQPVTGAQPPGEGTQPSAGARLIAPATSDHGRENNQASSEPDPAATMYLTIVGDQRYVTYGLAGQRTARVDDLPQGTRTPRSQWEEPVAEDPIEPGYTDPQAVSGKTPADTLPGPAPQQCPRTLPPGSTQGTADGLRDQFGCRYLSSCRIEDGVCTWFYQGQG